MTGTDTKVEADETLSVLLGAITAATATQSAAMSTSGSPATGTILNNDTATLTIGNVSVAEGGNLVFTVTLSAAVQDGLTVAYTTNNGTATTSDGDYTDNDGSLTFTGTAGETKTITVVTGTDTKVEADETLSVLWERSPRPRRPSRRPSVLRAAQPRGRSSITTRPRCRLGMCR